MVAFQLTNYEKCKKCEVEDGNYYVEFEIEFVTKVIIPKFVIIMQQATKNNLRIY